MSKTKLYQYVGNNGILLTPVKLPGVDCLVKYRLVADDDKLLTNDDEHFYPNVTIPEEEVDNWKEVKGQK